MNKLPVLIAGSLIAICVQTCTHHMLDLVTGDSGKNTNQVATLPSTSEPQRYYEHGQPWGGVLINGELYGARI